MIRRMNLVISSIVTSRRLSVTHDRLGDFLRLKEASLLLPPIVSAIHVEMRANSRDGDIDASMSPCISLRQLKV